MAGLNGLTPTLYQVLQIAKMGVPVTPTQINDHIGKGNYASKHILYLKILGYDFDTNKDGRSVVSYTLTKVPDNHQQLIDNASGKGNKIKTAKTPKVAKTKSIAKVLGLTKTETKAIRAEVAAEKAEDIKAKNLETMKKVAAKFKAKKTPKVKKTREFDDVVETFGTSGEVGTSFSVERDWDSVEGLDLSKLIG